MRRGDQAGVEAPETDEKRLISGSIRWRAGQAFLTEGRPRQGRDTALFLRHPDDLRCRLRRRRKIHVICGRAGCHTSGEVAAYLREHRERVELHLPPAYSPGRNPIERAWWRLHEAVTRSRGCESMQELLDLTFAWLAGRSPFRVEGAMDPRGDGRLNHFPC